MYPQKLLHISSLYTKQSIFTRHPRVPKYKSINKFQYYKEYFSPQYQYYYHISCSQEQNQTTLQQLSNEKPPHHTEDLISSGSRMINLCRCWLKIITKNRALCHPLTTHLLTLWCKPCSDIHLAEHFSKDGVLKNVHQRDSVFWNFL